MNDRSWQLGEHVLRRRGLVWPAGFFTGQAGCFCCAAAGVTVTYHTFYGNKTGAVALANNQEWSGGSWTTRAAASVAQISRSAADFADGIAYFACGFYFASGDWQSDTDKYASSGDSWTALTDPPLPVRDQAGCAAVSKMYVMAGNDTGSTDVADNDEYDTAGDSWANKTDIPAPLRHENAGVSDGTYAYSIGGITSSTTTDLRDNDQYSPSGDSWTAKTDVPTPARSGHGEFVISGKAYMLAGGTTAYYRDVDEYDMAGDSWTARTDVPLPARQWMGSAAVAASAAGWITGGQGATGRLADHDEYAGGSWTNRTDLPADARMYNCSASC